MKTGNEILRIRRKRFSALLTVLMMLLNLMPGFSLAEDDPVFSVKYDDNNIKVLTDRSIVSGGNEISYNKGNFTVKYKDGIGGGITTDSKHTVREGIWGFYVEYDTGDVPIGIILCRTAVLTFKVENGYWEDGTSNSKTMYAIEPTMATQDESISYNLFPNEAPKPGDRLGNDYKTTGSWKQDTGSIEEKIQKIPETVSGNTTFTYTFEEKLTPTVTKPTGKTLDYTGNEQVLADTGSTSDGCTMKYALGDNADTAPTSGWDTTPPSETKAGDYFVWYKVEGNENYKDVAATYVTSRINQANNPAKITESGTVMAGGNTLDLSGLVTGAQGKVTYAITGALDGCSVDQNGTFTSGGKTGTCTVTVTVAGNDNYKPKTATITITVTEKDTQTLAFETSPVTKTYGDAAFKNPVSGAKTNVTYEVTDGTDVATVAADDGTVTIKAAGTAEIKAKAEETNTVAGAEKSYTLKVDKKPITITAASDSWTYDGSAHSNTAVTVTEGSLVQGDTLSAKAAGSVTNVADTASGNNKIADGYKVMRGDTDVTANYAITTAAGTLTITAAKPTVTAPTAVSGLKYTGSAQTLVNAGSAKGGTMYYASATGTEAPATDQYSTSVPTGIDAGTYAIWYMVKGNANYLDTDPVGPISVTIDDPDPDAAQKKTNVSTLDKVPDGLSGTYSNLNNLKQALIYKAEINGEPVLEENVEYLDVELLVSFDGGKTWVPVTLETFPKEGITTVLAYPEGTNKDEYDFIVRHMFTVTSEKLGTKAGDLETPPVTKTDNGLQVTFHGLSPVAVAWMKKKAAQTEEESGEETGDPNGGENGDPNGGENSDPNEGETDDPNGGKTDDPNEGKTDDPNEGKTDDPTENTNEGQTVDPTTAPTEAPTEAPTIAPTEAPTAGPTDMPTVIPIVSPTVIPTVSPTATAAPVITPTPTPAPIITPVPSKVPKTGDGANLALWLGMILLGLIGIGGLVVTKRRRG